MTKKLARTTRSHSACHSALAFRLYIHRSVLMLSSNGKLFPFTSIALNGRSLGMHAMLSHVAVEPPLIQYNVELNCVTECCFGIVYNIELESRRKKFFSLTICLISKGHHRVYKKKTQPRNFLRNHFAILKHKRF